VGLMDRPERIVHAAADLVEIEALARRAAGAG
jgi:hypothetical protein